MRDKSKNPTGCKEKPCSTKREMENEEFPEMMDENWKPSFMEMVGSRSWKEHLMMYFASFGTLLYLIASPQDWKGWTLVIMGAAVLAIGYWTVMINFNRCYIKKANQRLLKERRRLDRLQQELQEKERQLEKDTTNTTRDNKQIVSSNSSDNESNNINMV